MFDPVIVSDRTEEGIRKVSFQTSPAVCSVQIDVELEGERVRRVQYTKGCQGNTLGLAALCEGRSRSEIVSRLSGIDCKGRGTSCPDQLARALKMLE